MQTIGLLIEFKDGKVKEANFGMATAASWQTTGSSSPWWSTRRPPKPKRRWKPGRSRIVNITHRQRGWDPAVQAEAWSGHAAI
jgi:hypothetical protein